MIPNLPNGEARQITNYDDNIGFVKFAPDGSGIVFGKAKGGDENTQFFWMKADGTGIKELTASPKVRHNFGDWSEDGTKIYYASNKRNPQFFDVYAMKIADGKEELLYHPEEHSRVVILRRALTGVPPVEAMELLLGKLKKTKMNIEFLLGMGV